MERITGPTGHSTGERGAQAHLIKADRLRLGMSQKALARRLGVHEQTVAHLESGRRLATSEQLIGKLAELFGYHPDQLYIAAHLIPPDLEAWIAARPQVMIKIRELMDRRQAS
ncbi:MAG TPA: helix-turn-helix transcriptional regulator [Chloroflexota bacterium]|nr:helix-turn-helix transcriptional regulator [Chloroflexota bacterium]